MKRDCPNFSNKKKTFCQICANGLDHDHRPAKYIRDFLAETQIKWDMLNETVGRLVNIAQTKIKEYGPLIAYLEAKRVAEVPISYKFIFRDYEALLAF